MHDAASFTCISCDTHEAATSSTWSRLHYFVQQTTSLQRSMIVSFIIIFFIITHPDLHSESHKPLKASLSHSLQPSVTRLGIAAPSAVLAPMQPMAVRPPPAASC